MNHFDRLTSLFIRFPGIGSRQAGRFAYFLLQAPKTFTTELIESLSALKDSMVRCTSCYRHFEAKKDTTLCSICSDKNIDKSLLMVVAKDVDVYNMQKSNAYHGYYFVLGGLLPLIDKEEDSKIRTNELVTLLKKRLPLGLKEIILALNANPEGDNTILHLLKLLEPFNKKNKLKITKLGRGLSTGTELEYSDDETIKNAMENRK